MRVTAPTSVGVAGPFAATTAVVAAREQQPRQRRVAAVRRAGPPHDRLMLRARERDVREPQVLSALLDQVLLHVRGEVRAVEADVDRPRVVARRVVEEDRLALVADPGRLPQVGEVDDRELEPLAAVDREHLHGLGVGLQPAAALLVAGLLLGGGDPLAQPRGQRGRAEPLGGRGGVQELADVAQVREMALAVDARQQPAGQPLDERDRLQQRRDALRPQHPRPLVQPPVDLLPVLLAAPPRRARRPSRGTA